MIKLKQFIKNLEAKSIARKADDAQLSVKTKVSSIWVKKRLHINAFDL